MDPKPLPFDQTKLKGISEKALAIHHDKLYAGYVAKINEVWEKLKPLVDNLKKTGEAPAGNATYSELRGLKDSENFAINGVYLHEWYFDLLGGDGAHEKAPELSKALIEKWDSVENGIKYISECAMAARGWAVVCWDTKSGKLKQYNADAHNQGGVWGCLPIIVLDVYEHAYFIDYGSDKKKYIEDFWRNFNWQVAEQQYLRVREFKL